MSHPLSEAPIAIQILMFIVASVFFFCFLLNHK